MPASSKPGTKRQIRMKKDLHKSHPGSPRGFSTDLKFSVSSTPELTKTVPSHYIFNRKKTYLKVFPLKVPILFSIADFIPSCARPEVICGVYSPISFPFLNFLANFHFPGPSLAPLYLHQRCVVGTTVSSGSQAVVVGNVHTGTISDGLSPSCGCWPSGSLVRWVLLLIWWNKRRLRLPL